jgi:RimJ/RimL family protein N-acetyltransferase
MPGRTVRSGQRVALCALRDDEPEILVRLAGADARGEFNDLGPVDDELVTAGIRASRLLVVRLDTSEAIGFVSWHRVRHGPNRGSRAWNIGINLAPEGRGQGFGVEAQRLLAEHLFETTEVDRVEASTDVDNVPEQRALEKAGFTRDGRLRGAQERAGARHDLYLYSLLRSDLEAP